MQMNKKFMYIAAIVTVFCLSSMCLSWSNPFLGKTCDADLQQAMAMDQRTTMPPQLEARLQQCVSQMTIPLSVLSCLCIVAIAAVVFTVKA